MARLRMCAALMLAAALTPHPAKAAPDRAAAERLFAAARDICGRDNGRLWGASLCGPILLVDHEDRAVIASHPDAEGRLTRDGEVYRGVLPQEVIIANTPTQWSGTRWAQLVVAFIPEDPAERHVLLAHELFHRIQPQLGLTRPEAGNQHLDSLEGRYLLQLEWRALAAALRAPNQQARRAAVEDALAFRQERYRLFPHAADDEAALEISEGVPEYTGVRIGLATREQQRDFALFDLTRFVAAPTFVRSFAYATGPAYGLLLDESDPQWRTKLSSGRRLDELLAAAMQLPATPVRPVEERAARYDNAPLRAAEVQRDAERRARLAQLQARLIDGPILTLPLRNTKFQFNPQTLMPLEGVGTIYPTLRLVDDWGSLQVESGGALVRRAERAATVSAVGADSAATSGDGWQLQLNPGWIVAPGARAGDLKVVREERGTSTR